MDQMIRIYEGSLSDDTAFDNAERGSNELASHGWFVHEMSVYDFHDHNKHSAYKTQCIVIYRRRG